jgi:type III restriction enzyme
MDETGKGHFQIEYHSQETCEPDFVVETKTNLLVCEIKGRDEMAEPIVQAKLQRR